MKKIFVILLVVLLSMGAFAACWDGEYKVEFYVNGRLVHTERTEGGKFSYEYEEKEHEAFVGWYTDADCTKKFNGHTVKKDTKLYGKVYTYKS